MSQDRSQKQGQIVSLDQEMQKTEPQTSSQQSWLWLPLLLTPGESPPSPTRPQFPIAVIRILDSRNPYIPDDSDTSHPGGPHPSTSAPFLSLQHMKKTLSKHHKIRIRQPPLCHCHQNPKAVGQRTISGSRSLAVESNIVS